MEMNMPKKPRTPEPSRPKSEIDALSLEEREAVGRPPRTAPASHGHTKVPVTSHRDDAKGPKGVGSPQEESRKPSGRE
jgi:hypothetical protein